MCQGCNCVDRHQCLAKRNVHAESVDSFVKLSRLSLLFLSVVTAENHAAEEHASAPDAMAIE